jgi:hypothetical protein
MMGVAAIATFVTNSALANQPSQYKLGADITVEQAASMLHYSGGNDRMRVEIAPNYSEELGFSLKGAVGSYLTDAMALGLIVEYGEHKREYLANAGVQFNDALSFVGTVGLLEEHNEYVAGEGREEVQQMEYGASLKAALETGILSGFELNGYLADADGGGDSVETGKLYGAQLVADVDLTDTTHFKLGGGYEWLEWDNTNAEDNHWTFSAEAAQQLGDTLSLTGHAKLGASEYVYGGGLAFDLSNGGLNTNIIGATASYIDGKNGIEDDQRVELSWSIGFGAGPTSSVAAADLTDRSGTIRAAADVAMVSPANNLLGDVMKRPAFLPERVIARTDSPAGPYACYRLTTLSFVAADNVVEGIRNEFGSQARLVDWDEIAANFADTAEELDVFLDSAGLLDGMEAWVTRGGLEFVPQSSNRYQAYNSAGSAPGGGYAVLDHLQNYGIVLGRWYETKKAFAYICD